MHAPSIRTVAGFQPPSPPVISNPRGAVPGPQTAIGMRGFDDDFVVAHLVAEGQRAANRRQRPAVHGPQGPEREPPADLLLVARMGRDVRPPVVRPEPAIGLVEEELNLPDARAGEFAPRSAFERSLKPSVATPMRRRVGPWPPDAAIAPAPATAAAMNSLRDGSVHRPVMLPAFLWPPSQVPSSSHGREKVRIPGASRPGDVARSPVTTVSAPLVFLAAPRRRPRLRLRRTEPIAPKPGRIASDGTWRVLGDVEPTVRDRRRRPRLRYRKQPAPRGDGHAIVPQVEPQPRAPLALAEHTPAGRNEPSEAHADRRRPRPLGRRKNIGPAQRIAPKKPPCLEIEADQGIVARPVAGDCVEPVALHRRLHEMDADLPVRP